jgi:molecular chaperone DnaK
LFGGEGESSPAEPSSAVEPESGSGLLELELDELQSIPPQEAGLEERGPAPPPSGLPPALGEPDSIVVDDGYAAEVESFAPGGLRRYRDAGAGDVDIEVDLPELPEPPTVPEAPQTGFELDLGDDWAQADSLGGPSPAAGPAASAPPRDGTTPAELPAEHRASVAIPERPAPLLMDVTPQSLGLETAGGYCQHLIERNSPIPAEQTRTFTTARDGQQAVTVRVCQGETREFAENQLLGEVELTELRQAPRGQVRIEVSFILDANGTLDVKAVDVATGREQSIRINLLGGLESSELDEMRERQQSLLEASP